MYFDAYASNFFCGYIYGQAIIFRHVRIAATEVCYAPRALSRSMQAYPRAYCRGVI
jgi:hypothetical protein